MDLLIRAFEETVVSVVNGSDLPLEVKRLVIAEVLHKVEVESNRIILQTKESEVKNDGKTV